MGASLTLVLLTLLGQAAEPGTAELIRRLGSPRFAEREVAGKALESLGRDALPALRAARDAADPEVRSRATDLAVKVERDWLTRPTLLPLDVEDRPLGEVVRAIDGRNGLRLELMRGLRGERADLRRITVHAPGPLTFWDAIDRIGRAGDVRPYPYNFSGYYRGVPATALLPRSSDQPLAAHGNAGPFRASLVDVDERFFARLLVEPEPRMFVVQDGQVVWFEAVDDRGRSIVPPMPPGLLDEAAAGRPRHWARDGLYGWYTTAEVDPRLTVMAELSRPVGPVGSIKRLRGVMPVMVAAREPDPLVVPLKDAEGKTFRDRDFDLTLRRVAGSRIEMTVPDARVVRPALLAYQFDVQDAGGRLLKRTHVQIESWPAGSRISFNVFSPETTPDRLIFYRMIHAPTEVALDFADYRVPKRP